MRKNSIKFYQKKENKFYISENIDSPFVYGTFHSYIVIPESFINQLSEKEIKIIIMHELVHVKRFDNLIKLFWIMALSLHWFNPILLFSYKLFQKDVEISCDEKVLSFFKTDIRKLYANLLISSLEKQNVKFNIGLLGFGESDVKGRVNSIMNYKKRKLSIIIACWICVSVFASIFLTNCTELSELKFKQ